MQFAGQSHVQVASVYGEGLLETLYKQVLWNIHESPWLMIPTPAALVCPKTYDTVAEDACNIASHLSIDCTQDKGGVLRQARYIQAVLKQTFQRTVTARKFSHPSRASHLVPTNLFKCEVRAFFCLKVSGMQFAGHSKVQLASVYEKDSFETLYKQVLWNIHESPWLMITIPAAMVCPRDMWHCGRRCL